MAIFVVYGQVGAFDFTSYDDNLYVTDNPHVKAGLTADSIRWALTGVAASNWMPVTLLSHMLDCSLFGQQSGMHHLMNVLYHFLATVLLFLALQRATGEPWPSAFVAFLFAVHPLHVESVAWVAERKDVLSALFAFLTLYLYVRYAQQPSTVGYLVMALAFALGLMAKPMLVTLPFALLLVDVWPLKRGPRWLEKLPLIAMSIAVSVITFVVQRATEAVKSYPFATRIENALIGYVVYLWQTFWPSGLAALYPYQPSPALWAATVGLIIIVAISVAVVRVWRTRPYLATGWFWYLGMLVPVIGIVQVGLQSRADRYMYLPMVGLLIMIAWGAPDVVRDRRILTGAAVVAGLAYAGAAYAQTAYWHDSGTLFQRAVDVTRDNYVAEYNLANYLMNQHRGAEAAPHFEAALRIHPDYPEAENNLGMLLGRAPGGLPAAIPHFERAVELNPKLVEARYNLAVALAGAGRRAEALQQYQTLEKLQPSAELERVIENLKRGQ